MAAALETWEIAEEAASYLVCLDAAIRANMTGDLEAEGWDLAEQAADWDAAWSGLVELAGSEKAALRAIAPFIGELDAIVWAKRCGWVSTKLWRVRAGEALVA